MFSESSPVVAYGAPVILMGAISSTSGDTTVKIYRHNLGTSGYSLVDTVPATVGSDGAVFLYIGPPMKTSAYFKAVWDGDDQNLGASATVLVAAQAKITVSAKPATIVAGSTFRLTAKVLPSAAGHQVFFERFIAKGKWARIAKAKLGGKSTVAITWKPKAAGQYKVRARIGALAKNAAAASTAITVKVKPTTGK